VIDDESRPQDRFDAASLSPRPARLARWPVRIVMQLAWATGFGPKGGGLLGRTGHPGQAATSQWPGGHSLARALRIGPRRQSNQDHRGELSNMLETSLEVVDGVEPAADSIAVDIGDVAGDRCPKLPDRAVRQQERRTGPRRRPLPYRLTRRSGPPRDRQIAQGADHLGRLPGLAMPPARSRPPFYSRTRADRACPRAATPSWINRPEKEGSSQ
jgi:hypothetical protein